MSGWLLPAVVGGCALGLGFAFLAIRAAILGTTLLGAFKGLFGR